MSEVSVDDAPASAWNGARPNGLAPALWAKRCPTEKTLIDMDLPAGTRTYGVDGQLLGWTSAVNTDGLAELWLRCARQFPDTGLWPVCDTMGLEATRAWTKNWVAPYRVARDVFDVSNLPDRESYFDSVGLESQHELMESFHLRDLSMRVARPEAIPDDPLGCLVAPPDDINQLTLVTCRRPADSVLTLDFGVPNDDATPGFLVGVLRSWESRFGLVPVRLGDAWTTFQVIVPPSEEPNQDALASEIFCFAMDSAIQGGLWLREGKASAQELATSREWKIWWD